MINYPAATAARIAADVHAIDPDWLGRAAAETDRLIQVGGFRALPRVAPDGSQRDAKPPSLWGDVKIVYMRLQRFKCIYCERALAGEEGKIEHDVEHYRPKNAVKPWRAPKDHPPVTHVGGGAADTGYYWLAYELENYAVSCKPCNSTLKRSYFPVASNRGNATDTMLDLDRDEQPYLIFPMREDPAQLITFHGATAVPRHNAGADYVRAITTIALFRLNTTPELIDERFRLIRLLSSALELVACSPRQGARDRALLNIADLTGEHAPHSACGKAFLELTQTNPELAYEIVEEAWAALPRDVARP